MSQKQSQSEMPDWLVRGTVTVVLTLLGFYAAFWVIIRLRELITWLVIALFLSFALEPLTNRLQARGWKRATATGVILTSSLLLFLILVGSMVPLVISQGKELVNTAPHLIQQMSDFLYNTFKVSISTQDLIEKVKEFGGTAGVSGGAVATNVIGFGGRIVGGIFQLLTIYLFTFYLVVDGPKVRRKVMAVMQPKQQRIFLETWEVAIEKMGGYLYVRIILAGLTSLTAFLVMTAAGVPFALPLALWMGLIAQFIPVIGTYIAVALPLLVAVIENPLSAVIVLIYAIVYQQVENYIISPKLTARTMQLHPAVAISAAIAGGSIKGPVGAFLALPAAAILQVVVGTYITRHEVIDEATILAEDGKK